MWLPGVQVQGADGVVVDEQPQREHAPDPGLGDRSAAELPPPVVSLEILDQVDLVGADGVHTRPLLDLVLDRIDRGGISSVAATVVI